MPPQNLSSSLLFFFKSLITHQTCIKHLTPTLNYSVSKKTILSFIPDLAITSKVRLLVAVQERRPHASREGSSRGGTYTGLETGVEVGRAPNNRR